jgi:hypothetical protein
VALAKGVDAMMESTRRRPNRSGAFRHRVGAPLEALESRMLMTGPTASAKYWEPVVFAPRTISHASYATSLAHPVGNSMRTLSMLDNDGKVVSGQDRQGDQYTITVHGPGVVIVTDATPGDSILDDDIDTIQILGADPHRTYVTGQVTASARVITDGQVPFNHLISENGVQSIILNGFNLADTVPPPYDGQPANTGPEIYLPGGVKTLQFNNVFATLDQATEDQPFEIVIGDPTTSIPQKPNIKIGSVFNSVVNSSTGFVPNGVPVVDPTVSFMVNGQIDSLEMVSATRAPVTLPGYEILTPIVGSTGRTSVRALGINRLKVAGGATNFVASRAGQPFQPQTGTDTGAISGISQPFTSSFSGLDHLGSATFGGPTDAVGLDVDGPIGHLRFGRGIGNPTGAMPGLTNLGYNPARQGYASFGMLGGLITAEDIRSLQVGPNNLVLQTSQDPGFIQLQRQGSTQYYARPGHALTSTAITTEGSINSVDIVGDAFNSEVKTGFDYKSYIAGLDGTRAASEIRHLRLRGSLVDSVISASYRPNADGVYGTPTPTNNNSNEINPNDDVAGPGLIRGNQEFGGRFFVGGTTALGFSGSGFYARTKIGHLPPPNLPTRLQHVALRP